MKRINARNLTEGEGEPDRSLEWMQVQGTGKVWNIVDSTQNRAAALTSGFSNRWWKVSQTLVRKTKHSLNHFGEQPEIPTAPPPQQQDCANKALMNFTEEISNLSWVLSDSSACQWGSTRPLMTFSNKVNCSGMKVMGLRFCHLLIPRCKFSS